MNRRAGDSSGRQRSGISLQASSSFMEWRRQKAERRHTETNTRLGNERSIICG